MKNSYIDLMRQPDSVLFQFDDSGIRFEEPDGREERAARLDYAVSEASAKIILYPGEKGIKRVKLRWRGDMSDVLLMLGDEYERSNCASNGWTGLFPCRTMPWYFHIWDGEKLNSFGVMTGPSAFCFWECDAFGITLWLDVRCGGAGVRLCEPLTAATVVCREGMPGETPYETAHHFCRIMCEKPNLPAEPVFGANNWYWAYGKISHESVMAETAYLQEMCVDADRAPYMILDDGWQASRYKAGSHYYNGGPWDKAHTGFSSMAETAACIKEMGAKPGLWFRPLKTAIQIPEEALSCTDRDDPGLSLDPTHPFAQEMVETDVRRIRSWGYELIKHDFSIKDAVASSLPYEDSERRLYDDSITSCEALRQLYLRIQRAADGACVISCNTPNHLAAGIHQVQRSGADTSGRSYEITRNNGVHSLVRLPQNGAFFAHDPDCAAFTERVSTEMNLDFMEACAITGAVTLASVTPGILKADEMARIRQIYRIASQGGLGAIPTDWLGSNEPSHFVDAAGNQRRFDWYRIYDGVRTFYTWFN